MRLTSIALAMTMLAAPVWAAGSDDDSPPTPSETTTQCSEGQIFDIATQSCMAPEQSTNDDNASFDILRELVYAGRLQDGLSVLAQMDEQDSARIYTYRGFIARKSGDFDTGLSYYQAALELEPNYFPARSYMGQGYVAHGQMALAEAQLREIRARGGRGTWSEYSLRTAIESGQGYSY